MVFPAFVDMHTHLDKGHIWPRSPNPDGSFMGALTTVRADSAARWSAEDVRPRMSFSLRCAYAHGTRAIRTHLDSIPPQDDISWPVFRELQADWADRIDLQAVCLIGATSAGRMETGPFRIPPIWWRKPRAACWAWSPIRYPIWTTCATGRASSRMAAARGLDADFHVDETMDQASRRCARSRN
jgi:cytosine deaminase